MFGVLVSRVNCDVHYWILKTILNYFSFTDQNHDFDL